MLDISVFNAEFFLENKDLQAYFAKDKHSKLYTFYTALRNKFVEVLRGKTKQKCLNGDTFHINKQDKSYEFDVTQRTVRNWLNILQEQGFIKFSYLKHDLVSVTMLDYTKIEALYPPKVDEYNKEILPNRFYKEAQLRLTHFIRQQQASTFKLNDFEGEWVLEEYSSKKELAKSKELYVKLKQKDNNQVCIPVSYEYLTSKTLPSLKCHFHQNIINKNFRASLINALKTNPHKDLSVA
ncbi:hypothetical protein [Helicobacter cetorum]|uniref:Uncharacterized protein n=1 Tax=Helicobacter cetorum (strain ATCC BAA-540 / CCUG 52418 / MIT 99-5656) TaxID=1163745 RepID=I0EUA5_HELCM|nr:hypothetical protein [Helicobacter cetorum]AFI06524.1 hypothetical protein HCD_07685 [Helicobacter cetorum MIT 99-5656]